MQAAEIREKFLQFFEGHGHRRVASSSLIPANDPTLLFANAGMNQFKDLFLGREKRDYTTAASSQKCVRAGGKHNDLDNVGYTARHNTFFEMLGNFSFGDYFKERAIPLAWQFLTETLQIPADRLYVTVFTDDDEAFGIWRDQVGVPTERIFRFGEKDNFWAMGDTGPCGPCSEIFYDYGDLVEGPADPYEAIAAGSDKIIEVWNLVFMQYDRDADGTMNPLPNPSIDTGMGLERISAVMQQVTTNFETDLFRDIIEPVGANLGLPAKRDPMQETALRVIADHLRAMAFLIADGVTPSNEGRGYVLRRIMRRAMRYGKQLGQEKPFLFREVQHVIDKMGGHYDELPKHAQQITTFIEVEEQQFDTTLSRGMPVLTKYLDDLRAKGQRTVPGQVVHFLYGTHGFPVDLMADIARDYQLDLDLAEHRQILEDEAKASQDAGDFSAKSVNPVLAADAGQYQTEHTVYQGLKGAGTVKRILMDDEPVTELAPGQAAQIVLDSTSFYAESGGQIGDKGEIRSATGVFQVEETTKVLDKLVVHHGQMRTGSLQVDQAVETHVDESLRRNTMKNHTATHLFHQALRSRIGLHVRQAGSLVDPDKLRFDFSHFSPLTDAEIRDLEDMVNREILADNAVDVAEMPAEEARNSGAIAFFGEKYGERVRVVSVGDFSKEFCGGTHVNRTGEIGCFKIVSERGLAAGVRRVVALTGPAAVARFRESENLLKQAQDRFHFTRDQFIDQIQTLQDERKALEKKIEALKLQMAKGSGGSERVETVGDTKVLLKQVSGVDGGQLRQLADEMLGKLKTGVVLIGSELEDKVQLIAKTNVDGVHAGHLVRDMAAVVGGKGGGRPDMAMAGGRDSSQLPAALDKGLALIQTKLG